MSCTLRYRQGADSVARRCGRDIIGSAIGCRSFGGLNTSGITDRLDIYSDARAGSLCRAPRAARMWMKNDVRPIGAGHGLKAEESTKLVVHSRNQFRRLGGALIAGSTKTKSSPRNQLSL
jgi:hypothetical protein